MLGLPKRTECKKTCPKSAIYKKFELSASKQAEVDAVISRITIIHDISPVTTNIPKGETVQALYVMHVVLKKEDYDVNILKLLGKLLPHKVLFVLEYKDKGRLALFHGELFQSDWHHMGRLNHECTESELIHIELIGTDLDTVWQSIVERIGTFTVHADKSLDETIQYNQERLHIEQSIERLEKKARKEIQPRRKWELLNKVKELKAKLSLMSL